MKKQFKPQGKTKWIVMMFPIIPFIPLFFGDEFDSVSIFNFISYTAIMIGILYRYNQTFAEIKDEKIYFYAGIGLYDPKELELSKINSVEKKAKKMLLIIYDGDKRLSVEAEKTVIDQIVDYFQKK